MHAYVHKYIRIHVHMYIHTHIRTQIQHLQFYNVPSYVRTSMHILSFLLQVRKGITTCSPERFGTQKLSRKVRRFM